MLMREKSYRDLACCPRSIIQNQTPILREQSTLFSYDDKRNMIDSPKTMTISMYYFLQGISAPGKTCP